MSEGEIVQTDQEQAEAPAWRRDATVMEIATVIANSRDFPECRSPEKAAVRILAGREMGIGEISSVLGIRISAGRLSMDAGLVAGLVKRSGRYDYRAVEHTAEKCVLEFTDNGQPAGVSEFTMADAKKAGLADKDVWKKFPRNLLFARALTNGARWYCPGLFSGAVYSHEELGVQVDEDGRATGGDGAGSDLCSRDQRQEIVRLAGAAGKQLPELLQDLGVRLLDELSGYEADKLIKKLGKQAAKANAAPAAADKPGPVHHAGPAPAGEDAAKSTPAQQMMADAFAEIQPCTDGQRDRIITLAERLAGSEDEAVELIQTALANRGLKKIAELSTIKAAELIEAMEARLADAANEPPFDPSGQAGSKTH